MIRNILFVCTGNTCRSPMAEGMLRDLIDKQGLQIQVHSAGVSANEGLSISEHTARILKDKGIANQLTSKAVTEQGIEAADLILTMTTSHKRYLIERFPQIVDKAYTLKEYVADDPAVMDLIQERKELIAELQMKLALSQEITKEEQERLIALEQDMPNYDVMDPYGGSMEDYRRCADEIEACLIKLLRKI